MKKRIKQFIVRTYRFWVERFPRLQKLKDSLHTRYLKFVKQKKVRKPVMKKISSDIIFIADVDYHIRNAAMVIRELRKYGVSAAIIEHCADVRSLRDDEKSEYHDIAIYGKEYYRRNDFRNVVDYSKLKALITYNDRGSRSIIVQDLNYHGIPTVCVKEGIYDFFFLNEDPLSDILPYRSSTYLFLSGAVDALFFKDRLSSCYLGGLAKVRTLLDEPVIIPENKKALVNVNFSYGNLACCRNEFLDSVREGCRQANIPFEITQHPEDRSVLKNEFKVTDKTMYDAISDSSIYISRYANGILEALAMGKPVVYHNPHNEAVIAYQDTMGAFSTSTNAKELAQAIEFEVDQLYSGVDIRKRAEAFLQYHANLFDTMSPADRITYGLLNILERHNPALSFAGVPEIHSFSDMPEVEHSSILSELVDKKVALLSEQKKVSVVIYAEKSADNINHTLESLVNQTFRPFEYEVLIAAHDLSDDILHTLEDVRTNNPQVELFMYSSEKSASDVLNDISKKLSGEYTCFLEAGDFLSVVALNGMYNAGINNLSDIVVCMGSRVEGDTDFEVISRRKDLEYFEKGKQELLSALLLDKAGSSVGGFLISTELILNNDVSFSRDITEDRQFLFQSILKSNSVCVVNDKYYNSRSLTRSDFDRNEFDYHIAALYANYAYLIDVYGNERTCFLYESKVEESVCRYIDRYMGYINRTYNKKANEYKESISFIKSFISDSSIKTRKSRYDVFRYKNLGRLEKSIYSQDKTENVKLGQDRKDLLSHDVLFFASVDYHIRNIRIVISQLEKVGFDCAVIENCTVTRQLSKSELHEYDSLTIYNIEDILPYEDAIDFTKLKAFVTYSAYSPYSNKLLNRCYYSEISTFSVIEGVWDFPLLNDGHTRMLPYRNSRYVFLSGAFDSVFYEDRMDRCFVGGLAKVRELLSEGVSFPKKPQVLINANFSYDVLIDRRKLFLDTAIEGCMQANVSFQVTKHPGYPDTLDTYPVTKKSMYEGIADSSVFVSRYANGILEALAMGTPVVYHNPHDEPALAYQDPMGAFRISRTAEELAEAINAELKFIKHGGDVRERARDFLQYHTNIFDEYSPEERIAGGIERVLSGKTTITLPISEESIKHSDTLLKLWDVEKAKINIPKVSIVIPVYNVEEHYLRKCIESAVDQTLRAHEYEILIVNDASTEPHCLDVINEYAAKYSQIIVIDKPVNEGLGMARNSGIDQARGEFMYFLDGDDFIAPETLDEMYIAAKLNGADLVPSSFVRVRSEGADYEVLSRRKDFKHISGNRIETLKNMMQLKISSVAWAVLVDRDLFIKHNIRYPQGYIEDQPVSFKLYSLAKKIHLIDKPFYNYLVRTSSITGYVSEKHIDGFLGSQKERRRFLYEHLGRELASNQFTKFHIPQKGIINYVENTLLRWIGEASESIERKIELVTYLYNKVNEVEYLRYTPLAFYSHNYPRVYALWKIFRKHTGDTLQICLKEYLNMITWKTVDKCYYEVNDGLTTVHFPNSLSRIILGTKFDINQNDMISTHIDLTNVSHDKAIKVYLSREFDGAFEGTSSWCEKDKQDYQMNHTFENCQKGYRLMFESRSSKKASITIKSYSFHHNNELIKSKEL